MRVDTGGPGRAIGPDLGQLLDTGPFEAAFRVAIRRRGLTLDRLRAHLAQRGIPVALSSLSNWQHGRRRPGSAQSLRTVCALEEILGLPTSSLIRLLADPEPGPPASDALRHPGPGLAAEPPRSPEQPLEVISTHEKVTIDAERRCASIWSRTVVRAQLDGVDRHRIQYFGDAGCVIDRVELDALENCQLGQVRRYPSGVIYAELLFDHTPRAGETWVFENRWSDATGAASTEHAHAITHRGQQYLIEIRFDATAVPARCYAFVQSGLYEDRHTTADVTLNRHHAVHLLASADDPGVLGIGWTWS
jgi:hypothetical protein